MLLPKSAAPLIGVATGAPTGQAIVLQNKSGTAVQIIVTPDSGEQSNTILTADDIEQLAPYLDLSQATPLQIATGVTGMTFTDSEHPAYGTSTEEVLFTYRQPLRSDRRRKERNALQIDDDHVDVYLKACAARFNAAMRRQSDLLD